MAETTRRYPRTLAEAFPQDRAHAIEHYRSPGYSRPWWAALALLAVAAAVAATLTGCGGGGDDPPPAAQPAPQQLHAPVVATYPQVRP